MYIMYCAYLLILINTHIVMHAHLHADEEEETEVDTFDVSAEVAHLQLAPPPLKASPSNEPVL